MYQQSTILQRLILNPKKITKKLPINCKTCGIEFLTWKSRIERALRLQGGNMFCSHKCARQNQPKRLDKFVWCSNCKWVEKTKLISIPKGQVQKYNGNRTYKLKKDQFQCPTCKDFIFKVKK